MKEVAAIKETWQALKVSIEQKLEGLEKRATTKPSKIVEFEKFIVDSVMEELAELQTW
jgi:hypothetical protein